jgi:hypothetical protein
MEGLEENAEVRLRSGLNASVGKLQRGARSDVKLVHDGHMSPEGR